MRRILAGLVLLSVASGCSADTLMPLSQPSLVMPFSTPGCYAAGAVIPGTPASVSASRSTAGTITQIGTTTSCAANEARVGDWGLLVEGNTTQLVGAPTSPATETTSLGVGTYWMRLEGSGSIAITAAGATATGLPCTVTAASSCAFDVSGAGNVTRTVTGTVTFAQLTAQPFASSKILTAALRANEAVSIPTPSDMTKGTLKWRPNFKYLTTMLQGTSFLGTGTNPTSFGLGFAGTGTFWQSYHAVTMFRGTTTISGPEMPFDAFTEHEIGWEATGTKTCLYINGIRKCVAGVTSWSPGATVYLGGNLAGAEQSESHLRDIQFGAQPVPKRNPKAFAALGDSITLSSTCNPGAGSWMADLHTWTKKAALTKGSGWIWGNFGVAGDKTDQMLSRFRLADIDNDMKANGWSYLFVMGGTNDIASGRSVGQTFAFLKTIYTEAQAAGMRVIPITVLPNTAIVSNGHEANRAALNTEILAWCTATGNTCVDAAPEFDDGDGELISTYTSDGTHLSQAGCDLLASLVVPALP